MPTSSLDAILRKLNDYDGDNIWQDVIGKLAELDPVATESFDPFDSGATTFFLSGGECVRYDQPSRQWCAVEQWRVEEWGLK